MQGILVSTLETWGSFYANHAAVRTAVGFMHVGGLLGGGGCAIAADRIALMTVRQPLPARPAHLESVRNSHRIVIAGLVLVTVSGLLMTAADADTFIHSEMFWIKMGLFAMLLVNGVLLLRAGRQAELGDERSWRRLAVTSVVSIALWFCTTLAGAALLNMG